MKKNSKIAILLLVCLLVFSLVLGLTACKEETPDNPTPGDGDGDGDTPSITIGVPTDCAVDESGTVSWTRVSGASSYELEINGKIYTSRFTRYDLYSLEEKPADGTFVIKVRAVAKDDVSKSDWSAPVNYIMQGGALLYPVVNVIENGVVTWFDNDNATDVLIYLNGEEKSLGKGTTSYDLKTVDAEEITFSLLFKGDGVYYTDSIKNTLIYTKSKDTVSLPAPQNVRMEGQILKFDAVIGADTYYLRDCNNTVISVTTNEIDVSSMFLKQSVGAGISSGVYHDSAETPVVYFEEKDGKGTESDPFVITTPDQFRYIEYYEGMGESCHYVLGNDILFEEIQLPDDEAGSNTYKLGSFSGVLDGKGYSLINVTLYANDGYTSLFTSLTKNAVIKNVTFENAKWRTWTIKTNDGILHEKGGDVSMLAYINRGTIKNVHVKGSSIVAVKDGASSLVTINEGTIENCSTDSETYVYGSKEAGGICIFNEGRIVNCKNAAKVEGNLSIGGIVGRNAGFLSKCDNTGDIKGNTRVGGIAGYNYNVAIGGVYQYTTQITYCSNSATVSGSYKVGGITGQNGTDGGDETGSNNTAGAGVYYSYNLGSVTGNAAGGVVGSNYAVKDNAKTRGVVGCFNMGQVTFKKEVAEGTRRVFVDTTVAASWITNDGGKMYCYYWGGTSNVTWPGIPMTPMKVGSKSYWYVDIDESAENVIFNRCGFGGTVYNQSVDIAMVSGKYLYILSDNRDYDDKWTGGSWTSSASVEDHISAICGGLAGYNSAVNDCYFLQGSATVAGNADGNRNNGVYVGNLSNPSGAQKSADYFASQEFVNLLNSICGGSIFVKGESCPIFIWQK